MVTASSYFVLVLCFGFILLTNGQSYESCLTPRLQQGTCILITNCNPLFAILQKRPIALANAEYLRKSQCGFEGTLPKVCCPVETTTEAPSVTQPPNKVPSSNGTSSPLLPTDCGANSENRIYGGEKTDLDEFPWMALIEYERPNKVRGFYCGGVLISSRYVMTAAHCVIGKDLPKDWKLISVRLGEHNTDEDIDCVVYSKKYKECAPEPVNVAVEDRIPHEDYDPYDANQYHDIALLRLVRPVTFTGFIKPICLPNTPEQLSKNFVGKKVWVAGWGKTETKSESNVKLKLLVPVKSAEVCTNTYRKANVHLSEKTQLCAGGEKGKDSCRGDSGGPLMVLDAHDTTANWYSIGVVSFGPTPCGMENWPGVYTNVANYVPWIISKLKP